MPFQDVAAERAILAGVCRYGIDAYYDVADLVEPIVSLWILIKLFILVYNIFLQ